jgi:hypothetical protein
LLVVLDDGDLHQRQTPFSLGASRAIASTLNSLVFHTAFPEAAGQQQQQPGQHLKQQPAAELSAQVAAATLAHGMVSAGRTGSPGTRVGHTGNRQHIFGAVLVTTFSIMACTGVAVALHGVVLCSSVAGSTK